MSDYVEAAAPFAIPLLFAALLGCSSSGGVIQETIQGGPGQPIEVRIGAKPGPRIAFESIGQPQSTNFVVEVSNNSDADVVVDRIAISQPDSMGAAFQLQPVTRSFKELIEPGKEHDFELQADGRQIRILERNEPSRVVVRVVVVLQSGEQYVYEFEVPVSMQSR